LLGSTLTISAGDFWAVSDKPLTVSLNDCGEFVSHVAIVPASRNNKLLINQYVTTHPQKIIQKTLDRFLGEEILILFYAEKSQRYTLWIKE
jgi:hypothetical protein